MICKAPNLRSTGIKTFVTSNSKALIVLADCRLLLISKGGDFCTSLLVGYQEDVAVTKNQKVIDTKKALPDLVKLSFRVVGMCIKLQLETFNNL